MSMTHVARGELLQRQDRLDEADEALTRGAEPARRGNAKFDLSYALVIHAGVKARAGDRDAAEDILGSARLVARTCVDPGQLIELVARAEATLRLRPNPVTRAS